jgi:hypothetical protein
MTEKGSPTPNGYRSARALLLFFGGLGIFGVVVRVIALTAAGHAEDLVSAGSMMVLIASVAAGLGLIAVARQLSRGTPWARTAAVFALLGIALLVGLGTGFMAATSEGDAGANAFIGGVMLGLLCLAGVVSLLRTPR